MAIFETGSSVGVGFGLALGFTVVIAGYIWYESRPRPPKLWNTTAITATFDRIDTEGQNNTLLFAYTLENNTLFDYKVTGQSSVIMTAKLNRQRSLSLDRNDHFITVDYPIFIPSGQRTQFLIHLGYPYRYEGIRERPIANASSEERKKYREAVAAFVNEQMGNVDGFVLFDEINRYQITFPKGW